MFRESGKRTFIKMISWRVWATLTTIILVYIFVGKIEIAVAVGGIEVIAKMILYYLHERVWDNVKKGRHAPEPFVLWFTGLPCSGKSSLAKKVYQHIIGKGYKIEQLDGDVVRAFFPNTGFSKEERDTHICRIGYLASMLEKNGVIVVASFVSPYRASRDFVRKVSNDFIEVYVSTPLEECEKRDSKGMYEKARKGDIKDFTGISDPYEVPENADIVIDTTGKTTEESCRETLQALRKLTKIKL